MQSANKDNFVIQGKTKNCPCMHKPSLLCCTRRDASNASLVGHITVLFIQNSGTYFHSAQIRRRTERKPSIRHFGTELLHGVLSVLPWLSKSNFLQLATSCAFSKHFKYFGMLMTITKLMMFIADQYFSVSGTIRFHDIIWDSLVLRSK